MTGRFASVAQLMGAALRDELERRGIASLTEAGCEIIVLSVVERATAGAAGIVNARPLAKGAVYHLKTFGPAEYLGMDVFHGETTHLFRTSDGSRYIRPDRLASELSSEGRQA